MVVGILLIVIGLVFFAKALGYIAGETLNVLWPLILIVIGFSLLSNRLLGEGHKRWYEHVHWDSNAKKKRSK